MNAVDELRDYLAPRDRGLALSVKLTQLAVAGLAVSLWLSEPATRHDAAQLARRAADFSANWTFYMLVLATVLAFVRVASRLVRPVTAFAASRRLVLRRSPLGRRSLHLATEHDGDPSFANPLAGWQEAARLAGGDANVVVAALTLCMTPAWLAVNLGSSVQDVAATTVAHVFAAAMIVWALPLVVDRVALAAQLAGGLRARHQPPAPPTRPAASVDPFWGDSGRQGELSWGANR